MKPDYEVWLLQHLPYPLDRLLIFISRILHQVLDYIVTNIADVIGFCFFVTLGGSILSLMLMDLYPDVYLFRYLFLGFGIPFCILSLLLLLLLIFLAVVELRQLFNRTVGSVWRSTFRDYPIRKKKDADE